MDWLKELLKVAGIDETQIDGIIAEFNKEVPKHLIPKEKYNEVAESKKQLETDLAARDTQLEELSKTAGASDELKAKIEKLQDENKTAKEHYEAEIKQIKIDNAVERALTDAKAKNTKAVKALLDLSNAELDGESIKGLDDQIKALVSDETSSFLFESADKSQSTFKGFKPGEAGNKSTQTDPSKMTYSELTAYMAANPGVQI